MFAISYFVGSKYGRWINGAERFSTHEAATAIIAARDAAERAKEIAPFMRRAVAA